jgi:hypothetical protein
MIINHAFELSYYFNSNIVNVAFSFFIFKDMRIPIYPNDEAFIQAQKQQKYERLQEEAASVNANKQFIKQKGNINYM